MLGSALSSGSVFLQVITRSSVIIKINSPSPFAVKFHFVKLAGNDWLSFTCCSFLQVMLLTKQSFFMGNVPIYKTKLNFGVKICFECLGSCGNSYWVYCDRVFVYLQVDNMILKSCRLVLNPLINDVHWKIEILY